MIERSFVIASNKDNFWGYKSQNSKTNCEILVWGEAACSSGAQGDRWSQGELQASAHYDVIATASRWCIYMVLMNVRNRRKKLMDFRRHAEYTHIDWCILNFLAVFFLATDQQCMLCYCYCKESWN